MRSTALVPIADSLHASVAENVMERTILAAFQPVRFPYNFDFIVDPRLVAGAEMGGVFADTKASLKLGRSYIMHSMGEEFGPFPLEFLQVKLAAGHFFPWMWVTIVEDGKRMNDTRLADVIASADAGWQRNLAVSYSKRGDVFVKRGLTKEAIENYSAALTVMERLAALDPTNALWLSGIIEYNYDLAKNGDDSARRFAFIAACLGELNAKRGLTAEQRDWLAEAETQIAKLQLH